jgi:hypothetical protein
MLSSVISRFRLRVRVRETNLFTRHDELSLELNAAECLNNTSGEDTYHTETVLFQSGVLGSAE